jgi:uncharacterized membrane protein
MKKYQIRFNTESKSDDDKWRLIEDGKEILVREIFVNGLVYTSEDLVGNPPKKKWHISCLGECEIINGKAHIDTTMVKKNALLRHTLKTISYRVLGTLTTFTVSYVSTGSVTIASTIGVTELMIKPVIYFFHERIWYKFVKYKK